MRRRIIQEVLEKQNDSFYIKHVLGDISGVFFENMTDINNLESIIKTGINRTQAHCISIQFERVSQNGTVLIAILKEGRVTLHLYPEQNLLCLDVLSYKKSCNPKLIINTIVAILQPDQVRIREVNRGDYN
ncbi:S-adenosylmethionine decarboxylase family protein [Bacillus bingmayongensis]|uniref:S-adenosylmethionine decarboxylase family protein n=1 Tax=Bacillus bingmayongensis TaxID=1150157 RepID=UPI0002DE7B6E|nr:S-adenosylmethionine decarboxylase [Bacillus bingmayongensis]MBY0595118.1 S-adenosylmethionine decarboxylase [Bacillus bingmayongensis]